MIKTKIIVKPKDGNSSSGSVTEGSYGSGYADYAASAGRSKQSDRSALATLAETAISAYRAKRADMASELDPDSETLQGYVLKEWLGKLLSVVDVDGTEQDINGTVGDGMKIMPHLDLTSIDVSGDGHISLGGMQMVYDAAHGAWRLDGSLYVTGGLSALGNSDVAGGGGGGLDAELLWSLLGNRGTEQISKSHLADALAGYATEEWVEGRGYLTNRDAYTKAEIDAKDWSSNKGTVTSVGIAMPTGFSVSGSPITEKGILAIGFATGYSLPTTAKQSNWDTVYNWYSGITGSDTDTIINKWGEIISFLDGIEDTATLSGIVNGINQSITDESNRAKAEEQSLSKSITDEVSRAKAAEQALTSSISTNTSAINVLKGYFTNGVAKSAVKLQTARKIWGNTFDGTQDVAGDLILPNGKKIVIGTASLSWDADNNAVKIDGSVYATGGLSALGNSDTTGGGGGGLMGTIVPYAKAIALTTQNEGAEIASAWSVKMLYDKIENVDVSGQLTSYLTKQEAQTLYQPVGNYLTAHQSLDGYVNGIAVEGTGNAVTTVAKSGKTVTFTKGATFLTAHQSLDGYVNGIAIEGTGNAVTTVAKSGKTVIFTKGANYLTGITKAQVEGVLTGNITSHTHSQYLTSHQDISGKADRSELLGYLPLSGGTMTGGISWLSESALPNSSSADYLLVIDAFANGGRMKWINTSTLRVSQLTNDAGFITSAALPTKVSQLSNDSGYITSSGSCAYASTAGIANSVAWSNVSGRPTSMPASDVYAWAKASSKPGYSWSEIDGKPSTFAPSSHTHKWAEITDRITKVSQLSNDSGYITSNASISGNAGSATRLQTARTIWGQSFNGTGNVSGEFTCQTVHVGRSNEVWGTGTLYIQNGDATTGNLTLCPNGGGNVGVGTADPKRKFHVEGTSYFTDDILLESSDFKTFRISRTNVGNASLGVNSNGLYIYSNVAGVGEGEMNFKGGVGLGIDCTPQYKLHVAGDITATGGVNALSDVRHKDIVADTVLSVADIAKMRCVYYRWNDGRDDDGVHVGSIAQDWQSVLPEVVSKANDADGTLCLQYGVAALVSGVTIARRVVCHESRIKELELECERLQSMVELLSKK
ncbi:MAG: tail fiber domain-containing protein [Prevotella sp.]|nr:tail fiber domain-containing protein [Prevotella sp.]